MRNRNRRLGLAALSLSAASSPVVAQTVFTIAPGGPSGLESHLIFRPCLTPVAAGPSSGLIPTDNIKSFSDPKSDSTFVFCFSVDPETVGKDDGPAGMGLPPYDVRDQFVKGQHTGDGFISTEAYDPFAGPLPPPISMGEEEQVLVINQAPFYTGGDFCLLPDVPPDLKAAGPLDDVDGGGKGPLTEIFFVLEAGNSLGVSGATVLYDPTAAIGSPGGDEVVYATFAQLGLFAGDQIDALSVIDDGDRVFDDDDLVFLSLDRDSPTLTGLGASPATVFRVMGPFRGAAPEIFATASELGLLDTDNIDMIELVTLAGTAENTIVKKLNLCPPQPRSRAGAAPDATAIETGTVMPPLASLESMRSRVKSPSPVPVQRVRTENGQSPGSGRGNGPSNDECNNATAVFGSGPFNFDNSIATTGTDGQANPECDQFGSPAIDNDLWFCWTADSDGAVTVATCGLTAADTKIAVYDGCSCPPTMILGCNDDACSLQSSVAFEAVAGAEYLIQVGNFPGAAGGPGAFEVTVETIESICILDPAANCQERTLTNALNSTAGQFTTAEDFVPVGDCVTSQLCIWGTYLKQVPPVSGDQFRVTYFRDNGFGDPGVIVGGPFVQGIDLNVSGPVPTGQVIAAAFPEFEYTAQHAPVCMAGGVCYWVEIVNHITEDTWFWEIGSGGNDSALQDGTPPDGYDPDDRVGNDLAVCVNLQLNDAAVCGPPPAPNDECEDAIAIADEGAFPFDLTAATTGTIGQANPECDAAGSTAIDNDTWYCWTSPCTGDVTIETCGATDVDTRIAVYAGCECDDGAPGEPGPVLDCDDDTCGLQSLVTFAAVAGAQYLIQVGTFPGAAAGSGSLIIDCVDEACEVACVGTAEGEACDDVSPDTTNGGCNSDPDVFGAIDCNEMICGTMWAAGGTRDTDWFVVQNFTGGDLTVCVSTELPGVAFLFDLVSCDDGTGAIEVDETFLTLDVDDDCNEACATVNVDPASVDGQLILFIATGNAATGIFEGHPCTPFGRGNNYSLSLECTVPDPTGACCVFVPGTAQDCVGGLLESECVDLGGAFQGGGSSCDDVACDGFCPCDWNGDGSVNSADFFAFLGDFNAGDADYTGDGTTNSADLFAFLACFNNPGEVGC